MPSDVERTRAHAEGLSNVRIDGFQPPARVPLYLAAADLAALPNRSKPEISAKYTSPLKAFEYMASGLPIVASDLPSLREVLGEDPLTRFAEADSSQELADVIKETLSEVLGRVPRGGDFTWLARAERVFSQIGASLGS